MNANNITFATKTHMERYGLVLSGATTPRKSETEQVVPPGDEQDMGGLNLKQFRENLNQENVPERLLPELDTNELKPYPEKTRATSHQRALPDHKQQPHLSTLSGGSCGDSSYHSGSRSSGSDLCYTGQVSDSYMELNIRGREHRQHGIPPDATSDTTQYHTPDHAQQRRRHRAKSVESPVKRNMVVHEPTNSKPAQKADYILDLERIKQLPKLL